MKFYKALLLITISFTLSCSKDDQISKKGEITFDNQSYELNNGYINFRSTSDYKFFGIHLSNDITTFGDDGRVLGKDSKTTVDLMFVRENNSDNEVTFYPLRFNHNTGVVLEEAPPYLTIGAVNFNLYQENEDWVANPRIHTWDDGSATFENINGEYKITFHLVKGNTVITGNYKGPLEEVEIF